MKLGAGLSSQQWAKVLGGILLSGMFIHRAEAIEYTVTPCCQLCPAARDPASYSTSFLKQSRLLVQGDDQKWLFRSDQELTSRFGPGDAGLAGFKRLVDALETRGVKLVLVYQPTKGLVERKKLPESLSPAMFDFDKAAAQYELALARFRSAGAVVPDLTPLLDEDAEPGKEYYFRRDHHWTPYGAQKTAALVADEISKMPEYEDIPRKRFVSRQEGMIYKRGTLQTAFSRICKDYFPDQYISRFVSEPFESEDGEDALGGQDLFGDEALPEVTLVGTSFSNSRTPYNFDGFLKEDLSIDIMNEAGAGAGEYGSLMEYLQSDEFQTTPPKMIIWEVPSYYDLSSPMIYRQLVPLVYNGCEDKESIMTVTKQLNPEGATEVLFNGGGKLETLRSKDLMLDVRYSDPDIHKFLGRVWYLNGRKERIKLENPAKVDTQGRFVVELQSDPEWQNFQFLSLEMVQEDDEDKDKEQQPAAEQQGGQGSQEGDMPVSMQQSVAPESDQGLTPEGMKALHKDAPEKPPVSVTATMCPRN